MDNFNFKIKDQDVDVNLLLHRDDRVVKMTIADFMTSDNSSLIHIVKKDISKEEQKTLKDHIMLPDNDLTVCDLQCNGKIKSLFDLLGYSSEAL